MTNAEIKFILRALLNANNGCILGHIGDDAKSDRIFEDLKSARALMESLDDTN